MAEISADRQQKLQEEYEQLKEKILEIDHKYSLSYHEVKLDMPESLGLQKLTFTPHTEEELQQLALQEVKPKYDEKLRVLQKSTDTSKNTVLYNISVQEEKNRQQLSQLEEQLSDDKKSLSDKLAYNGLWYSTVKQQAENSLQQDYLASVEEQNTRHEAQIAALEEKITQLDSVYREGAASIQEQLQTALAAEIEVFREKDEKQRIAVEKYNNTVDEKENKYKASCARALQYAIQAEYERAFEAAKIYAELGEAGVQQQMMSEKLSCCKIQFTAYNRTEALFVMSIDSFLQTNLGDYYSALEDWVNTILRP